MKILLLIILITTTQNTKKKKNITKAISILKSYKSITKVPPLLSLQTLKKLVKNGKKKILRKLFLENSLKIYQNVNFRNSHKKQDETKKLIRATIGVLGLIPPIVSKMKIRDFSRKEKNLEKKIFNEISENRKFEIHEKTVLSDLERIVRELRGGLDESERSLMGKVWEIRGHYEKNQAEWKRVLNKKF